MGVLVELADHGGAANVHMPRENPKVESIRTKRWQHDSDGIWNNHTEHAEPANPVIEVESDTDHLTAKYRRIHGPKKRGKIGPR